MGYAMSDAKYADHVVVVTDCLVDFPNMPASVEAIDLDAVVKSCTSITFPTFPFFRSSTIGPQMPPIRRRGASAASSLRP